ncbi:MAG: elongation factor P maturation arginine rhamnosyltransferase EarP, partial [Oscillospiraceae bacterium]
MRNRFEAQLDQLGRELIEMGALIESAIASSVKSLIERDRPLAEQIARSDSEIDQKESEIEALCLKLLLQQQPVARDLRVISSALKMITDMERIGDQAADIADIVIEFFACDIPPGYIAAMARCAPQPVWLNLEGLTAEEWVE